MRLKEIRKSKKLTQHAVAEALELNTSTYSHYERGDREADYDTLCRLANFLDVTVDELLGREQQEFFDNARIKRPEILEIYYSLPPQQQENLLYFARGMAVSNVTKAKSKHTKE